MEDAWGTRGGRVGDAKLNKTNAGLDKTKIKSTCGGRVGDAWRTRGDEKQHKTKQRGPRQSENAKARVENARGTRGGRVGDAKQNKTNANLDKAKM